MKQRISTVGYKMIFRKINIEETLLPFTVITNKDYFSRKKAQFAKFTVAVYVIYTYGRDVIGDRRLTTKSNELLSALRRGHASKPHSNAGKHLLWLHL